MSKKPPTCDICHAPKRYCRRCKGWYCPGGEWCECEQLGEQPSYINRKDVLETLKSYEIEE